MFIPLGWLAIILVAYTVYDSLRLKVVVPILDVKPQFTFFFAPWCAWSKKAKRHWEEFKEELDTNPVTFGGYTVNLVEVNGDLYKDVIKEYDVKEYPTFKLITDTETYTYREHPSADGFRKFLVKHMGRQESVQLGPGATQHFFEKKFGNIGITV